MPDAPAHAPGHVPLPVAAPPPRMSPRTPGPLAHSLELIPLLCSLSRTQPPNPPAAAVRCRRGHSHCVAPPMPSEAPPPPTLPPLRATRARTAPRRRLRPSSPTTAVGCRRPIRRLHRLPEHADLLFELTVSPCPFPLSPRARPRLLIIVAIGADSSSPPAMSPPRPRLCKHASEPTAALVALPRFDHNHPRLWTCPAMRKPPLAELRPPPRVPF